MVKKLDDKSLPDHIGIRLWRANEFWLASFIAAMNEAGHIWFTPARANLLGQIPRNGIKQGDLIRRIGLSKQAVQQLIDGLESEGILQRQPDPDDKRGKIIIHSEIGKLALKDADGIKLIIETDLKVRLGEQQFSALFEALGEIPLK
jgi:DNA-binding MarR family transcriptional regulator